jgi:hypothetical protein
VADYINNVVAADGYSKDLTLGPTFTATKITATVANNPALMQFAVGKEGNWRWTDERDFLAPASASAGQSFTVDRVIGVRFRNANPGQPARILCILSGPDDPDFSSGAFLLGSLTAGGSISPAPGSVQIERNDIAVGTEPILDLEDGLNISWQVDDDAPNTRIKATPQLLIPLGVSFPPAPADGQMFIYTADVVNGVYWLFRYSFAHSYWAFVGGPPLLSEVTGADTTAAVVYGDLAGGSGPSIVLPFAGDYDVAIGFSGSINGASDLARMSYAIGGAAALDADAAEVTATAGSPLYDYNSVYRTRLKQGLGAVTLAAKYRTLNGATATVANRFMTVLPVKK